MGQEPLAFPEDERFAREGPNNNVYKERRRLVLVYTGGLIHLKFQKGHFETRGTPSSLPHIKELEVLRSRRLERVEGVRLHSKSLYH